MKKIFFILLFLAAAIMPQKSWCQQTDRFIRLYRSDMETYCPGLLSDLEKKYGPSLGVNPERKSTSQVIGVSREIGTAMNEALSSITKRTEQVANTGVGRFTLYMIAYKIMGKTVLKLLIGLPVLLIFMFLFIRWWKKIGIPTFDKKLLNENTYKYTLVYPILWEQVLWACIFVGGILIGLGIIC